MRSQAEVGAAAAERRVDVARARQVEAVGVGEALGIAVRRAEPDHDLVAGPDRRALELDVARRGAAEVPDGRGVADQLVDGARPVDVVSAQQLQLIGELHQPEHPERHRLPGGLVAGDDHDRERVVELALVQRAAVDLGVGDEREDVVLRMHAALGVDAAADRAELLGVRAAERLEAVAVVLRGSGEHARELGVGVDEHRIAELDEAIEVLLRHAEQVAQHADRDRRRDPLHEVELAERQHLVQDAPRQVAQERLVARQRARREVAGEQAAPLRVQRRIGLHEVPASLELVRLHVLDLGDAADLGRERRRVLEHRDDVVIARHAPEPATAGLVVPVDGRVAAQQLEHVPRLSLGEQVVIEEIDVVEPRHGPAHPSSARSSAIATNSAAR